MSRIFLAVCVMALISTFVSCGYRLGGAVPKQLTGVKSIYVKIPRNNTQFAGIEADLTNALTDALISDATYSLGTVDGAEGILRTTISKVELKRLRAAIEDGLRPEELEMKITVTWEVISSKTGKALKSGKAVDTTRYFVDGSRLTTARDNGFPDALARVSRKLVSSLSTTF